MLTKLTKDLVGELILHTEKALLLFIVAGTIWAAGFDILEMFTSQGKMALADLFLLFIYAEILGMVGAFYKDHRIPITLPVIIAITALTRMLVITTKEGQAISIIYESVGILILAISAFILSYKEMMSLEKLQLRKQNEKA
jgi:protein PsiE